MKESLKQLLAMADLARLDLTCGLDPADRDAALERHARDFKNMVTLMDTTLAEVDTEGVEPLYWPIFHKPAAPREDVAEKHNSRDELLAGAPDQDGRFFVVPKIMG